MGADPIEIEDGAHKSERHGVELGEHPAFPGWMPERNDREPQRIIAKRDLSKRPGHILGALSDGMFSSKLITQKGTESADNGDRSQVAARVDLLGGSGRVVVPPARPLSITRRLPFFWKIANLTAGLQRLRPQSSSTWLRVYGPERYPSSSSCFVFSQMGKICSSGGGLALTTLSMYSGAVSRSSDGDDWAMTSACLNTKEVGMSPTSDDPSEARSGKSWSGHAMPALARAMRPGCR